MAEDAQKKTSDTESSIERCIQYVETKVCPTSVTKQARAELAQLNQAVEAAQGAMIEAAAQHFPKKMGMQFPSETLAVIQCLCGWEPDCRHDPIVGLLAGSYYEQYWAHIKSALQTEPMAAALAARYQPQPPEGHNQPCYYCGEPCNALAGNPGKWPLGFPHRDEPGVVKWQHVGCVVARLTDGLPENHPFVDNDSLGGVTHSPVDRSSIATDRTATQGLLKAAGYMLDMAEEPYEVHTVEFRQEYVKHAAVIRAAISNPEQLDNVAAKIAEAVKEAEEAAEEAAYREGYHDGTNGRSFSVSHSEGVLDRYVASKVREATAPLKAELQRIYETNSRNFELYVKADTELQELKRQLANLVREAKIAAYERVAEYYRDLPDEDDFVCGVRSMAEAERKEAGQ